jgi:NAD(P)-dependent dehydrogenase (short-subunit alcohol dehydrogenase family)
MTLDSDVGDPALGRGFVADEGETGPTTGVALVTGAARGIGKAVAHALAGAGFQVVVSDVDAAGGEAVVLELNAGGGRHHFIAADMRRPTEIAGLFDSAMDLCGRLDVLVNNAATTRAIDFFEVTEDDWDAILDLNAKGYFFAMQEAARRMERGGRIVNMSSIAGKGWKETSNIAYASSKGAVITMTRIAAAVLGPSGIRVNAVCPGMTKTDMMLDWLAKRASTMGVSSDALLADLSGQVPLGLLNEPDDVAAAVLFLATDASRTITGQSLNVDGGIVND